jgi:hypothetical protein
VAPPPLIATTADGTAGGLNGTAAAAFAQCPAVTTVVGGGFSKLQAQVTGVRVIVDSPSPTTRTTAGSWVFHGENSGAPAAVPFFRAFARCARLAAPDAARVPRSVGRK